MIYLYAISTFTLVVDQAAQPARKTYTNLSYANDSKAQKLDLYLPAKAGPYALVIWIHGGGFIGGDKANFRGSPILQALLDRGYATAVINYRLSGEAKFPAQIFDTKAAVRWLRANAATYDLNPGKVGVWGASAGGNLAALLATSNNTKGLEDLSMGNSREPSSVQVAIDWFGPTNFLLMDQMAREQGCTGILHDGLYSPESRLVGYAIQTKPLQSLAPNPAAYVSRDDPPMYIEHGQLDCTVPYHQSQLLYDSLRKIKNSADIKLKFLGRSGHGDNEFNSPGNISAMIDFLDIYLRLETTNTKLK